MNQSPTNYLVSNNLNTIGLELEYNMKYFKNHIKQKVGIKYLFSCLNAKLLNTSLPIFLSTFIFHSEFIWS